LLLLLLLVVVVFLNHYPRKRRRRRPFSQVYLKMLLNLINIEDNNIGLQEPRYTTRPADFDSGEATTAAARAAAAPTDAGGSVL
jgi:hypothetical protein